MTGKDGVSQLSGTIERTLRAIQCVAECGEFNLKDFASEIGIPTSTAYRLLQSLSDVNFVEKSAYGSYRIGSELFRLSSLVVREVEYDVVAQPFLRELGAKFQETCAFALYIPNEKAFTIVETVNAVHQLQYVVEKFTRRSMIWGALGRSMLPFLPEDHIRAALKKQGPPPEPNMPEVTREDLRAESEAVLREGCFVATSPNAVGTNGTAAPVFDSRGQLLGSIGLTVPIVRYDPDLQAAISEAVIEAARGMSAALGYRDRRRAGEV